MPRGTRSRCTTTRAGSVVKDDVQQRRVNLHLAVVLDEAEFAEFVEEKTDSGTRGPDHFGERFLTDFRNHFLGTRIFSEVGKQQ